MLNCIYYGMFLLQGINIIFLLWKDTTNPFDFMFYITNLIVYLFVIYFFVKFIESIYLYLKKEE